MNTTNKNAISNISGLKKRFRLKTILLNAVAELIASTIFSALYFIFISRYLSENFHTDYIMLTFSVGLAFFAAVYIPFHTYRIHIVPFITLITALRRKNPYILLHKVPAQLLGALFGVLIFNQINQLTTQTTIENIRYINSNDKSLLIFINAATASILCYGFYMIRVLFKSKQLTGTIYLSIFYMVLFAVTSFFADTSSLNPFGYLFYDLLGNQIIKQQSVLFILVNHILSPIIAVLLIFFYIKPKVLTFKNN